MSKMTQHTRSLALSAMIAAIYAVLTIVLAPICYGNIQCRISEAMTLLPMMLPQSIPGLFVGCFVANLYTGNIWDIVFGSLATLIAACGTYCFRRNRLLAWLCPVVSNMIIVGIVLSVQYGLPFVITALEVGAGEAVAVALGFPLLMALRKANIEKYFPQAQK